MRKFILIALAVALGLGLMLSSTGTVQAGNPAGTAQPSQSCQSQPASPGNLNSVGANPNTPFNETVPGGSTAGNHYAGSQPQNSVNPKSVSQYDVACYQVSNNPGH